MVAPLLRRNRLWYRANQLPGVNSVHPASSKLQASFIASGATFRRIDTPKIAVRSGSNTNQLTLIDGINGPSLQGDNVQTANSNLFVLTVAGGASGSPGTLAVICRPIVSGANLGVIIAAELSGGANNYFYIKPGGVLGTFLGGDTPQVLTTNTPYFLVWSWPGGTTNEYVAAVNLTTGATRTFTRTSAASGASTQVSICNDGNAAANFAGSISHGMYSLNFMSLPQLLAWANDPWSFWYPPTELETLNWLSTPVGPTFPVGGPMYMV